MSRGRSMDVPPSSSAGGSYLGGGVTGAGGGGYRRAGQPPPTAPHSQSSTPLSAHRYTGFNFKCILLVNFEQRVGIFFKIMPLFSLNIGTSDMVSSRIGLPGSSVSGVAAAGASSYQHGGASGIDYMSGMSHYLP